jgi:glycosyltransferase involved in cell wall biosynthesis
VVGFKAGAPEQIAMEDYSTFVEYADVDGLEKALRQWLSAQPDRQKIAQEAEKIYSVNAMIHGFLEVYQACDWSRKN